MRINRYLAMCNLGSRREVEELVINGKISVNNVICSDLATDIDVGIDKVAYDNKIVTPIEEKIYLALNKPKGYIVTRSDEYSRQTVFDLLPKFEVNLFAVGRLDKDSEGLLLLTNDGDFADKIMHPRYELSKIYKVEVKGRIRTEDLHRLQEGVIIDRTRTLPARIFIKKSDENSTVLRFTIFEGKNRQIRKMLESLGYKVIGLKRLQVGPIKLDDLPSGLFRPLKQREINAIINEEKPDRKRITGAKGRSQSSSPRGEMREQSKGRYSRERQVDSSSARSERRYRDNEKGDKSYNRGQRRDSESSRSEGRYRDRNDRERSDSRSEGRYGNRKERTSTFSRDQKRDSHSSRSEGRYGIREDRKRPYKSESGESNRTERANYDDKKRDRRASSSYQAVEDRAFNRKKAGEDFLPENRHKSYYKGKTTRDFADKGRNDKRIKKERIETTPGKRKR